MYWLTTSDIILIHSELVKRFGGDDGVRDAALLDSAMNAPLATFGGIDLYADDKLKIARLAYGLVCNHPFFDGNKRIGAAALDILLMQNNFTPLYTQKELIDIILALADGSIDYESFSDWVYKHSN